MAWDLWVFFGYDMGLNFMVVGFMDLTVLNGVAICLVVLDGVAVGL